MSWFIIPWVLGLISVFCLMVTMLGLMDKDKIVDHADVLISLTVAATWPVSLPSMGLFALLIVAFGKNTHSPIRFRK